MKTCDQSVESRIVHYIFLNYDYFPARIILIVLVQNKL